MTIRADEGSFPPPLTGHHLQFSFHEGVSAALISLIHTYFGQWDTIDHQAVELFASRMKAFDE